MSHYSEQYEAEATKVNHYKSAIEPVKYIEANDLGFHEGNIVKYVTRWKKKGGVDDLRKAKHYLEMLISLEV